MTSGSVLRSLASVQRPPTKGRESETSSGATPLAREESSHAQKVLDPQSEHASSKYGSRKDQIRISESGCLPKATRALILQWKPKI